MATLIADTVKARANFPVAYSGDVQVSTSDSRSVEQAIAPATDTTFGTIKIGDNIKNNNGEISIDSFVKVGMQEPTDGALLWLDTSTYEKDVEEEEMNRYSDTEETVVGKWIDNKPIYRKVFKGTTPANATNITTTILVSPDFESLVRLDYIFEDTSHFLFTGSCNTAAGEIYSAWLTDRHYIRHHAGSAAFFNRPVTWIVEFTKTTD